MKVDYYFKGNYIGSTKAYKNCKDAKEKLLTLYDYLVTSSFIGYSPKQLKYMKSIINNPNKLKTTPSHRRS